MLKLYHVFIITGVISLLPLYESWIASSFLLAKTSGAKCLCELAKQSRDFPDQVRNDPPKAGRQVRV